MNDNIEKLDSYHMLSAWILSQQSKCCSKKVGAILVKDDRILSSGYNGTLKGRENCKDYCSHKKWTTNDGTNLLEKFRQDHRNWSRLNEYHAEANVLDNANRHGVSPSGGTLYVTISPCEDCCKRIISMGIRRVVYTKDYDFSHKGWIKHLEEHGVIVDKINLSTLQEEFKYINVSAFEYDMVINDEEK